MVPLTYFSGNLIFNKPLDEKFFYFIKRFSRTKHIRRDAKKLMEELKSRNISPEEILPPVPGISDLGKDGKFFAITFDVDETVDFVQDTVLSKNVPPSDCPGLWCDIYLSQKNELSLIDGKNYHYVEWLEWLIKYFFAPAGYVLNGAIEYQCNKRNDIGTIIVKDNCVSVSKKCTRTSSNFED